MKKKLLIGLGLLVAAVLGIVLSGGLNSTNPSPGVTSTPSHVNPNDPAVKGLNLNN